MCVCVNDTFDAPPKHTISQTAYFFPYHMIQIESQSMYVPEKGAFLVALD